jgi:hypothetical protein
MEVFGFFWHDLSLFVKEMNGTKGRRSSHKETKKKIIQEQDLLGRSEWKKIHA